MKTTSTLAVLALSFCSQSLAADSLLGAWHSERKDATVQFQSNGRYYLGDRSTGQNLNGTWVLSSSGLQPGGGFIVIDGKQCRYKYQPDDGMNNRWFTVGCGDGGSMDDRWWKKIQE